MTLVCGSGQRVPSLAPKADYPVHSVHLQPESYWCVLWSLLLPPQSLIAVCLRLPDGYLGCPQVRSYFNVRSEPCTLHRVVS